MEKKECLIRTCGLYKLKVETDKNECVACGGKLANALNALYEALGFGAFGTTFT